MTLVQIEPGGHRGLMLVAIAFRLRPEVFGAAEDLGAAGDGAHRIAGGALGTGFDRRLLLDRIGDEIEVVGNHAAIASCAAR